ncbi:MAG: hypothetical protein ABSG91_24025 [Syntrophobacteraceae bacterium]|jgi:hypothetical protein
MIRDYLKKYDHHEVKLFWWFKSQGLDLRCVAHVLEKFERENRTFRDVHELSHAVVDEAQLDEIETILGLKPGMILDHVPEAIRMVVSKAVKEAVAESLPVIIHQAVKEAHEDEVSKREAKREACSIRNRWRRMVTGIIQRLNSMFG